MDDCGALRWGHVEVFVTDVGRARRFWVEQLGFEVEEVQHDGRIVWMRLGAAVVMLRPGTPPGAGPRYGRSGPGIALFTDDLPATLARLAERGLVPDGDDGPGCPTFRDPDGNWVQIVDPRHA